MSMLTWWKVRLLRPASLQALRFAVSLLMSVLAWQVFATPAAAQPRRDIISLKIIGGLAGVSPCTRYEAPFWLDRIGEGDMLRPMRLRLVPVGTIFLSIAGADEPELAGSGLAALNPDMQR